MTAVDWVKAFEPLIKQYKGRKHPLNYQNRYQLLVMVLLSAQDSDRNINMLAPALFERFPSLKALAAAKPEDLYRYVKHVRNFATKARWLTQIATTLEDDKNIPTTLEGLTKLPGIGRKSANVIIRESGGQAEGIIVDLHVRRVAPRIGIATSDKPEKIEKQMMELLPNRYWNDAGMACSFLGREICRPTNPKCSDCVMIDVCRYYKTVIKKKKA